MKNPKIVRALAFFLITALIFPIGTLAYELIYNKDDSGFFLVIMLLIFSVISYLFTIRYCSKLLDLNLRLKRNGQLIFYLLMTICTFLFSFFFFAVFIYDSIENLNKTNQSFLFSSDMEWTDIITVFGLVAYAILGIPMFFMQLNIRKQLIQSDEKIDDLIAAIGSENQNNT
jgi:hypothetical protein